MYASQASSTIPPPTWDTSGHDRWQPTLQRPPMASRQPSGHQRSLTEDNKRPPLVQLRSRSNTSTSSNDVPFARRALSPEFSLESSPRASFDRPRSRQTSGERPQSFRRGLIAKSSRLFKQRADSKDDLTSLHPLDWSEEFENDICPATEPETASRPVSKHIRRTSKSDDALQRYNISEPFNFQHLTHTEPVQYQKMKQAGHDDFVSEFSALRASQAPHRELRGIRADNIIPRDEFYTSDTASETASPQRTSDAQSYRDSYGSRNVSPSPLQTLHHARSIDSLSQISPILPRDPASPQTRATSHCFSPNFFADHQQSPSTIEHFPSIEQPMPYHEPGMADYPTAAWDGGVYDFTAPHAVTTPDDEAHTLRPPPFQMVRTELARVMEEDEVSDGRRSVATVSTVRPATPSSGARTSRSFPSLRQSPHKGNVQMLMADSRDSIVRPSSIFEQVPHDLPDRPTSCELVLPKDPETSWEAAVDWSYGMEAEADCNFDWHCEVPVDEDSLLSDTDDEDDRVPCVPQRFRDAHKTALLPCPIRVPYRSSSIYSMLASPARLPQRASSIYSALPSPPRFPHRASSVYSAAPALVVPTETFVPDLDPPSAVSGHSSLDSVSEAVTPIEGPTPSAPQQILTATCKPTCRDWTEHTPSVPVDDPESVLVYEDLYHVIYARKSLPEPTFDFGQIDGSTVSSVSPRSSHSTISKKSSQESVWSRQHRHSNSGGSVPELIHAKTLEPSLQALEATVTCSDAGQVAAYRRRSRSLAREVARQSVRSKIMSQNSFSDEADEPLPYYSPARDRSNSDASLRG